MRKMVAGFMVILLLVLAAGCSSSEEKKVVIASKPMTEQYILAEMLTALIEQNTDITVEQSLGIGGGTSNIHPGMESGDIDIYPEYTGTGWLFVLKEDLISDPIELYEAVKAKYDETYAITWMGLYGFNDTFGIAMDKTLADDMGIKTYTDLAQKGADLRFGAEYDFYEREDGYPGLQDVYGMDFAQTVELDIGLKYEAIGSGEVDIINVFSTDGRLAEYDLVVLQDDLNFFPSYYCTTLIRNETLESYPELYDVLNVMEDQISDEEMTYMNYLVEINKEDPKAVALDFLRDKGLIE